jgi:hypothetical protein
MNTTHELQKFGTAGYIYRGISIAKLSASRGRKYYEVNVTKFATQQYRANFYNTIVTYKLDIDTLAQTITTIDQMFDNGDLA